MKAAPAITASPAPGKEMLSPTPIVDSKPARVFDIRVPSYALEPTLNSGQAFRWRRDGNGWTGVIGRRWTRLSEIHQGIRGETAVATRDWQWLKNYLQTGVSLPDILNTFPDDEPLSRAVSECRGLRLLRQDPWECLASFILSSTKQIVQIRRIVETLCERFGERVAVPQGRAALRSFPSPERLAGLSEAGLRDCRMGFRAPYLLSTARRVASGRIELSRLHALPLARARAELTSLPGVGRKIADCVLLFACGHDEVFPVDVWIMRALRELYFPRRKTSLAQMHDFAARHFGPRAGFAQQYLFHYMRMRDSRNGGAITTT